MAKTLNFQRSTTLPELFATRRNALNQIMQMSSHTIYLPSTPTLSRVFENDEAKDKNLEVWRRTCSQDESDTRVTAV